MILQPLMGSSGGSSQTKIVFLKNSSATNFPWTVQVGFTPEWVIFGGYIYMSGGGGGTFFTGNINGTDVVYSGFGVSSNPISPLLVSFSDTGVVFQKNSSYSSSATAATCTMMIFAGTGECPIDS